MILMIIGATLPAAATAPSHTPVPTATGVDGGGAGAPSAAGGGGGSPAGAAVSRSVDIANETIALDMLGLQMGNGCRLRLSSETWVYSHG